MNGRRDERRLGYGFDPSPRATQPGICRGQCRGTERDRSASPAKFGTSPSGEKLIYCPCCNTRLRAARPGESGFNPGTQVEFATLRADVRAKAKVMVDVICRYDVIVFGEIVATDDATAAEPSVT